MSLLLPLLMNFAFGAFQIPRTDVIVCDESEITRSADNGYRMTVRRVNGTDSFDFKFESLTQGRAESISSGSVHIEVSNKGTPNCELRVIDSSNGPNRGKLKFSATARPGKDRWSFSTLTDGSPLRLTCGLDAEFAKSRCSDQPPQEPAVTSRVPIPDFEPRTRPDDEDEHPVATWLRLKRERETREKSAGTR